MGKELFKKQTRYPFPIRIWNYAGTLSQKLGRERKINSEWLLNAAQKETGLSDFGDDYFLVPLNKLIESINEEAQLNTFGRFVTRKRLINLLSNRLRVEDYFKRWPETSEIEILPIWWIVGLQRTGTTFLQRLIANTEGTTSIYSWEALNPVPFENDPDNERRIKIGKKSEQGLRYISPEFFAIHPVEHLAPEEEILLLDMSFLSTVPEATLHVPGYSRWLENQDQRPAYQYMRKVFKLLQSQRPQAKRWILKSPHHLEYLKEASETFPEAKFIFTHRDPVKTIASFCSMVYFSKRIFSSSVDRKEIADHWKRKISIMLKKSMIFRDNSLISNIDVSYTKFVEQPTVEVKRIFDAFETKWDEMNEDKLKQVLKINKKNKYGAHKYSLSDFGLNEGALENEFSAYRSKYSHLI